MESTNLLRLIVIAGLPFLFAASGSAQKLTSSPNPNPSMLSQPRAFSLLDTSMFRGEPETSTSLNQPISQPSITILPPPEPSYSHGSVKTRCYGRGKSSGWIFEPTQPTPNTAPVVIFFHGWGATDPAHYGAWIRHLSRQGYLVVYPRFQVRLFARSKSIQQGALDGCEAAFDVIDSGPIQRAGNKVAVFGHSLGGPLAVRYATHAAERQLPPASALFLIHPGCITNSPVSPKDLPAETLMLSIIGADDELTGEGWACSTLLDSTMIPMEHRTLLRTHTDSHGSPAIDSGHFGPFAIDVDLANSKPRSTRKLRLLAGLKRDEDGVDYTDMLVYWRLGDSLLETVFYGGDLATGLARTQESLNSGFWSDGTPIKPVERVEPNSCIGKPFLSAWRE